MLSSINITFKLPQLISWIWQTRKLTTLNAALYFHLRHIGSFHFVSGNIAGNNTSIRRPPLKWMSPLIWVFSPINVSIRGRPSCFGFCCWNMNYLMPDGHICFANQKLREINILSSGANWTGICSGAGSSLRLNHSFDNLNMKRQVQRVVSGTLRSMVWLFAFTLRSLQFDNDFNAVIARWYFCLGYHQTVRNCSDFSASWP